MDPDADPGWSGAVSTSFLGLVPGLGWRHRGKQSRAADGLVTLRVVYLSFALGFVLIGVVVAVLEGTGGTIGSAAEAPVAVAVVILGLASLAAPRLVDRPLPCDDEPALAVGYRQRFFLRIALAEAAALAGFVGYLASSGGWLYPLGAFFTAIGFVRLAPTVGHLQQDQEVLRARGCGLSLTAALRRLPQQH